MSGKTKVAGILTVALLLPSVFIITGILWFTATNFDHTEAKSISLFTLTEGGTTFTTLSWILRRESLRLALKRLIQGLADLI